MQSNNELISIIVPVYKVESYLEKCVNSLINQTYQNLEIILVDDGSPDNSGKLADELAKKDERIVVYHKANGGLSDARNYGVERAKGAYIGFVDSDDYIHEDMYQHLYQMIKKYQVKIAECNVSRVYRNAIVKHYNGDSFESLFTVKEYLKEYLTMEKVYGSVWCKLIDSNLAKSLTFPKGKYYEDIFYNYQLLNQINHIVVTSMPYYYYYIRENSITTEKYSPRQLDLIEILEKLNLYVVKHYPEYQEEAFLRLTYAYLSTFNHIIVEDNYKTYAAFGEMQYFLKSHAKTILSSKQASKQLKIAVFLINFSTRLYRLIFKAYRAKRKLNQ